MNRLPKQICIFLFGVVPLLFSSIPASAGNAKSDIVALERAFITNYSDILHAEYKDSAAGAVHLQSMIDRLLTAPSAETLAGARQAWIESRRSYLQTEVGRYYDGPIEIVEGFINAWPVDENYIDYTADNPQAGIVNERDLFPSVTPELLVKSNQKDGEKNVSTGYHAIEFLLWGQALQAEGPGTRSFKDFSAGTKNSDRRGQALQAMATLLVKQLSELEREWRPGTESNYREKFLRRPTADALANILNGLGNFSSAELSGERLLVPYVTKDRKSQHSCFSDATCQDLVQNELGIQDVFLGGYKSESGASIHGTGLGQLLERIDPGLAASLQSEIAKSLAAFQAIPPPFERATAGVDSDPGRMAVKHTLDELVGQTAALAKTARALNVRLNLK